MRKLWLIIKLFLLSILWLITCVLARIYITRSGYEYTDNDSYFDYDARTVYHQHAVTFYGMLLIVVGLITLVCTLLFVRGRMRKRKN